MSKGGARAAKGRARVTRINDRRPRARASNGQTMQIEQRPASESEGEQRPNGGPGAASEGDRAKLETRKATSAGRLDWERRDTVGHGGNGNKPGFIF